MFDKRKALQNLKQDKRIQADKYDEARKNKDELGMRRARLAIEAINKEMLRLRKG